MSNRKKKSNRRRPPPPISLPPPPRSSPPPPRSSPSPPPPSSSPSPPSLHPIMNLLPPATRSSLSSLSRQEMEVLAYMITMVLVMDTSNPTPSSSKAKETFENFPGNQAAHKRPVFGCRCFPCYGTYWKRWDSTSSSNCHHIHDAIEAFENSLQSWKNGNANSVENSANSRRNDTRCFSLPALEEVVEARSDKEEQDSAIDLSAEGETHRSLAGNVIAHLLNFFNPRMWSRKV